MLSKILLPFTIVSNLATLVGLWIAYASAPTSIQAKIGHVLIPVGAITSIVAYVAFAMFVMRPSRNLATAPTTTNDGAALRSQDKAQPSVVQENRQTVSQHFSPSIHIGAPDPRVAIVEKEQLRHDNLVLKFLKEHPGAHFVEAVASAVDLTMLEAEAALERLYFKKMASRSTIDAPGGFVYWVSDLVE